MAMETWTWVVSVDKWTDLKAILEVELTGLADGFSVDERKGRIEAVSFLALSAG